MLKKAGIVAALAVGCALSVSPLAFAGDYVDSDHGHHHHHGDDNDRSYHKTYKKYYKADCMQDNRVDNDVDEGHDNTNIVNISNNTLQANPQVCGNQIASGVVVGILGKAKNIMSNN